MKNTEAVIIGAGPAGIAAAIYLRRAGVEFLIFESGEPGGLLRNAWLVENYPGFETGVTGRELASRMVRHAETLGVEIVMEEVVRLEHVDEGFVVTTPAGEYGCRSAVVASGTLPVKPEGIVISPDAAGRVMYEVTEAAGIEGARFAVIGGGDAAFDYALSLAERNRVAVFVRGGMPRCLPLLRERCEAHERIAVHLDAEIYEIDAGTEGVVLVGAGGGEAGMSVEADYVVIATGRKPRLDFIAEETRKISDRLCAEGRLYLAGDVAAGGYRQVSIACGDGVAAAMRIAERLEERNRCG